MTEIYSVGAARGGVAFTNANTAQIYALSDGAVLTGGAVTPPPPPLARWAFLHLQAPGDDIADWGLWNRRFAPVAGTARAKARPWVQVFT